MDGQCGQRETPGQKRAERQRERIGDLDFVIGSNMRLLCSYVTFTVIIGIVCGTTTKYVTLEEDAPGTEIGNLSRDLKIHPAEDPDTSFRLMQKTNLSLIHMREVDGLLTVGETIDREKLCQQSSVCLITFDVVAFSREKFQLIHVEIEVKDINDHSPSFPQNETRLEIPENVPLNSRFPVEIAVDRDVGDNYIKSYRISHSNHFVVDVCSREDGVKYAELVLIKELDRELDDAYTIDVTATDGGNPPKSGSIRIDIKVLDYNDNSPTFEHSSLKVELNEDSPVGFRVLKVHAFDPDAGLNGEVVYGFVDGSSSEAARVFHLDPVSGEVTLKENVDYERRRSYELNIEASDLGVNSASSTCRVVVDIVDVNDNAPEVTIKPMTSTSDGVAYITEAAAEESFVALISTSDRDSGPNGYVRTSLEGHRHFKLQQAYGDTFMIVTTSNLDRERIAEYNLTVVAEDLGTPPFKTVKQYTIRISDENDNAPRFNKSIYDISISENNIPGSYITTVQAHDLDSGKNAKVTYSLVEGQLTDGSALSTFVSIDPLSGTLYSLRSFNFESLKEIELSVRATDKGSPPLSATSLVRIRVLDENDNCPYFTHPELKNNSADIPLPSTAPSGYLALRVTAEDEDAGENGALTFHLVDGDKRLFSIDEKSGAVVLKQGVTAQSGDVLQIQVSVSDNGREPLSSTATIRFIVTDSSSPEDQVLILLRSKEEERLQFDVWTAVVFALAGGCSLLLLAFAIITMVCRLRQRRNCTSKRDATFSLYGSTPFSVNNATSAAVYGGTRVFLNNERDLAHDCLYEEKSLGSEDKLFLPCKPFEQTPLWQDDKYCLQRSCTSNTDQLSMKDSGKGDSDFNDSDSDVSGEGLKRGLSTFQPWVKSSFAPRNSLAADWQGRYGGTCAPPGDVYTIGLSQAPGDNNTHVNPRSWKEACYGSGALKAKQSALTFSGAGVGAGATMPYAAQQKRGSPGSVCEPLQPNPDLLTVSSVSEVATTF